MRTGTRPKAALGPAAIAVAFALLCAPALAEEARSPLSPSNYTVHAVCPTPPLGQAACLALQLVPRSAQARSHTHPLAVSRATPSAAPSPAAGEFGKRPQDIHSAYGLPNVTATAQTIAVVDAYNDPTAAADLDAYDKEFALGECTPGNGCFTQFNQHGEAVDQQGKPGNPPFPTSSQELQEASEGNLEQHDEEEAEEAEGWGVEMSLDVQVARATCQSCKIVLVESDSTSDADLEQAEQTAVSLGATEVSNSWGGPECAGFGPSRACIADSAAFQHPGVVITASAGDDGYLSWDSSQPGYAEFPASSPRVVAVGGTRLITHEGKWSSETVWNDGGESEGEKDGFGAGGGGCSVQFAAQPWQQSVAGWSTVCGNNRRAVSDVSADADPYTGFAVHDSSPACEEGEPGHLIHWCTIGGTSLASPLIASVFALAGGAHGVEYPARTLYENALAAPASLHDVTVGSNGKCHLPFDEQTGQSGCTVAEEAAASCSSEAICLARTGYDGPTGVGTPAGIAAFQPLPGAKGPSPGGGSGEGAAPGIGGPPIPATTTTTGASPTTAAGARSAHVTRLALTLSALIALNRSRPSIHQLGFTFTIDIASHVRVSLSRRLRARGHARWRVLQHSLTLAATRGRNTARLAGHASLGPGVYRLSIAPVRGVPRSIVFTIG